MIPQREDRTTQSKKQTNNPVDSPFRVLARWYRRYLLVVGTLILGETPECDGHDDRTQQAQVQPDEEEQREQLHSSKAQATNKHSEWS